MMIADERKLFDGIEVAMETASCKILEVPFTTFVNIRQIVWDTHSILPPFSRLLLTWSTVSLTSGFSVQELSMKILVQ